MRQELFKEKNKKDIIPICYRIYPPACEKKEGKDVKCLCKAQFEKTCMTENDNIYTNKRTIKSFSDIEKDLKRNKSNLQDAIKKNEYYYVRIIEASRLLDAIDEFIDKNTIIISDSNYNHIKACLSIVASDLKETID